MIQYRQKGADTMNPYSYTPYAGYYGMQPPRCEIIKVHGEGGVDAYQMAPNSSALLLDETAPLVWLKTTDGAGYASKTPYTISLYKPAPAADLNSLEERIKRLEEKYHAEPDLAEHDDKPAAKRGKSSQTDDAGQPHVT